jgi:hypothetical protein
MKQEKRVTAFLQDEQDNLVRQGRLVGADELPAIERVFRLFNIQYDVDDVPPKTRYYSLAVSTRSQRISDNLLTGAELKEHISQYTGRGKLIDSAELKKLLDGKIADIHKAGATGEITIGYEMTTKAGESKFKFKLPSLKFGRKSAGKV